MLVIALAIFVLLNRGDDAKAGEVLLEAKAEPGPDPYTPDLETPGPPPPQPGTSAPPAPPNVNVTVGTGSSQKQVGLYGGTNSNVCDKQKLIDFLAQDSAKAAGFAKVLGIDAGAIPGYVNGLTPAILQVDTRVTNHGFRNGQPTPRQSVLQAGTAVLVDAQGTPRVRCKCGNPLIPPIVQQGTPKYTGKAWPEFQPEVLAAPPGTELPKPTDGGGRKTAAAGPNLVNNGDFEAGMGPWQVDNNANATVSTAGIQKHSGQLALQISNSSSFAPNVNLAVFQSIDVDSGSPYCLSFWAKTQGAQPGILSFSMDAKGEARLPLPPGTADWTQYAATFQADAAKVQLRAVSDNSGTVYVDDVELTKGSCTVGPGAVPAGKDPRA